MLLNPYWYCLLKKLMLGNGKYSVLMNGKNQG